MKLAILCGPLHGSYGGPASVVKSHYEILKERIDVSLFGVATSDEVSDLKIQYPDAFLFPRCFPYPWFRGKGFYETLDKTIAGIDVVHSHMVWDFPVYAGWRLAKKYGVPHIITTHGTFSESWRWRAPHKRLYKNLIADRIIADAAAIHVLNNEEADAIRSLKLNSNISVIPNGLRKSVFERNLDTSFSNSNLSNIQGKRVVLYLGRLWKDKGLDILPEAWKLVVDKVNNAVLVVAGPDYKEYRSIFMQRVSDLGISDRVFVPGPIYGEEKDAFLGIAKIFVLPSKSEGFSVSLLEAVGAGISCIYSKECNFPDLARIGGGWEIERNPDSLGAALLNALSLSDSQLHCIGDRGRRWAMERFSLENVGEKLLELYSRVAGIH